MEIENAMSRNQTENDFTKDYGKTFPVFQSVWMRPICHRHHGLQTGIHKIGSIDLNKQEFCVEGGWHRMEDYYFGAVEPLVSEVTA